MPTDRDDQALPASDGELPVWTRARRVLGRALRRLAGPVRRVLGLKRDATRLVRVETALAESTARHAELRREVTTLRTALSALVPSVVPVADAGDHLLARIPTGPTSAVWLTFGDHGDHYVLRTLARGGLGTYDRASLATTLALLEEVPGPFADVGANVGVFSLVVGACLPDRRVVGFEPTPDLAETFRSLVDANGREVAVEQVALGARDGRTTLYLSAATDSSNSLRSGFREATGEVDVEVLRFDSWLARDGGAPPTVVKIDTESTEPDVLRGAEELVVEHRPWFVIEVLHNRTEEELAAWCDRHGYAAHHLLHDGPVARDEIVGDDSYTHLNWLFAPGPLPEGFEASFARWHDRLGRAATVDLRPGRRVDGV